MNSPFTAQGSPTVANAGSLVYSFGGRGAQCGLRRSPRQRGGICGGGYAVSGILRLAFEVWRQDHDAVRGPGGVEVPLFWAGRDQSCGPSRNRFTSCLLVRHANVRDDRFKSREALPLSSASRQENNRDRGGIARHWVGPLRHGSSVKQPEALDHHGRRQIDHRGLMTDPKNL